MARPYGIGSIGEQMAYEVLSYYKAQSGEKADLAAILSSYDASGDYWRVIKGKDGKVAKVIDDGDYEHINVYDVNGNFEKRVGYQKGTSLVNAVMNAAEGLPAEKKGEPNWERVNQVMVKSGLDYEGGKGWYAKTEEAKQAKERALAERQLATTVGIKNQTLFEKAAQGISDLLSGVRDLLKPAQEINNQVQKTMLDTIVGWFNKPEKESKSDTIVKSKLQEKYQAVEGMPYAYDLSDEVVDKDGIVTKESKAMNCIGFLSYMYGFNCRYSTVNFDLYDEFTKLSVDSEDKLSPGDVIRWMGENKDDGSINNHVMLWAGEGTVMESVVKYGVRIKNYDEYLKWFKDTYKNIAIDYYRYNKETE